MDLKSHITKVNDLKTLENPNKNPNIDQLNVSSVQSINNI